MNVCQQNQLNQSKCCLDDILVGQMNHVHILHGIYIYIYIYMGSTWQTHLKDPCSAAMHTVANILLQQVVKTRHCPLKLQLDTLGLLTITE